MTVPLSLTLREIIESAFTAAKDHGWWDDCTHDSPDRVRGRLYLDKVSAKIPEKLMLTVTEVAEAMEDYRTGAMELSWGAGDKPVGFLVELADVIIRIADLVGAMGMGEEFEQALREKLEYNKRRPYRHGGKKA